MTTTTQARPRTAPAPAPLPSLLTTGLSRGRIEVTTFFREREAVVFIFALPAVLLLLLGSIFNSEHVQVPGVTTGQLYAAGMIAGGIAATSFQYLGISVASERDQGMLKRLYGTPLPHAAYFIGKIVQVFVCLIAEVTLLMIVGVAFYHLHLPSTPGKWLTLAWICLLGGTACALLGLGVSSLARSARSASPMITLPFLVLEFISGIFVPFSDVPRGAADRGRDLPAEVDGPGSALGVPAAAGGRAGARTFAGSLGGWHWCWRSGLPQA